MQSSQEKYEFSIEGLNRLLSVCKDHDDVITFRGFDWNIPLYTDEFEKQFEDDEMKFEKEFKDDEMKEFLETWLKSDDDIDKELNEDELKCLKGILCGEYAKDPKYRDEQKVLKELETQQKELEEWENWVATRHEDRIQDTGYKIQDTGDRS